MGTASRKTGDLDLELGRRIAERRDELGTSRKALAALTGLSYPHIAQIETGYRPPSAKRQPVLAKVLNISLDDLFGITDEQLAAELAASLMSSAPRRRSTVDEVVESATLAIEALPASVRLEAPTQVQLRVMQGVATDQARRVT